MRRTVSYNLIDFPRGPLTGAFVMTLLSVSYLGVLVYETPSMLNQLRYEQKEFMLLRGEILQFDEVLTMSAKMGAVTGNAYWFERYQSFEPRLDRAIQRAKALAASDEASVRAASQTDVANRILVGLELRAFEAVREGRLDYAVQILNQPLYNDNKAIYSSGMSGFLQAADSYLAGSIERAHNQARFGIAIASLIGILVLGSWCWAILLIRSWQRRLERTQSELREANTFLEMAADSAGVGPWRFSSHLERLEFSPSCLTMLGYEGDAEPSPLSVLRLVSREDRGALIDSIRKGLADSTRRDFHIELALVVAGAVKWVTCTGKIEPAISTARRGGWRLTGTLHDITNRRKAEAVLVKVNEVVADGAAAQLRKSEEQADALRGFALELSLAEQKERLRVSHLLHDNLQQSLVSVRFKLASVRMDVEGSIGEEMDDLDQTLSSCIDSARTLSGDLNPPLLFERGFVAVCLWMAAWMKEKYELNVTLDIDDEMEPPNQEVKILLFQCLRELLFNVVKHAETRVAKVNIGCPMQGVTELQVSDEGLGFDSDAVLRDGVPASLGLGLADVRVRVEAAGGNFSIESSPGNGTDTCIQIPNNYSDSISVLTAAIGSLALEEEASDTSRTKDRAARVLVVDHHSDFRRGLVRILNREDDFIVVGSTGDGRLAMSMAEELLPDIVLLDSALPRVPVTEVTQGILSRHPCSIVGLSIPEPGEISESMFQSGLAAYVTKSSPVRLLFSEMRSVSQNI